MREVERRAQAYGLPPIRWPDGWPAELPLRDAGRDLRDRDRPRRLPPASRLPPALRRGPRPVGPRQRPDRRRVGRAPPARANDRRPAGQHQAAPPRDHRRGRGPGCLRRPERSSSETKSSGATTASKMLPRSLGYRRLRSERWLTEARGGRSSAWSPPRRSAPLRARWRSRRRPSPTSMCRALEIGEDGQPDRGRSSPRWPRVATRPAPERRLPGRRLRDVLAHQRGRGGGRSRRPRGANDLRCGHQG